MRTRVPVLVFRSGPHKIGVQSELSPHKYTNTSAHKHGRTHTHRDSNEYPIVAFSKNATITICLPPVWGGNNY